MKLGIISDTHDQVALTEKAVALLEHEQVQQVFHLGDWCSPFMLGYFGKLSCPVVSIFGNNDSDVFKFNKVKPDNLTFADYFYSTELLGKKIACIHGDPEELAEAVARSGMYDFVFRGHNHIAGVQTYGDTTMLNPGSLVGPASHAPNHTPPSIALVDLATAVIQHKNIE